MKKFAFLDESNIAFAIVVSESYESLCEVAGNNAGIELEDNSLVGVGWSYVDNTWIAPVEEPTE